MSDSHLQKRERNREPPADPLQRTTPSKKRTLGFRLKKHLITELCSTLQNDTIFFFVVLNQREVHTLPHRLCHCTTFSSLVSRAASFDDSAECGVCQRPSD
jgi:hypothetical protein